MTSAMFMTFFATMGPLVEITGSQQECSRQFQNVPDIRRFRFSDSLVNESKVDVNSFSWRRSKVQINTTFFIIALL